PDLFGETFVLVEQYTFWGFHATVTVLLLLAGLKRAPLAFAGAGLSVIASLPPFLAKHLYTAFADGWHAARIVMTALTLLHLAGTILLLLAAASSEEEIVIQRSPLASTGLRHASAALWLRVIAAGVGVMLTFLAVSSRGDGAATMLKLALFGGLLV